MFQCCACSWTELISQSEILCLWSNNKFLPRYISLAQINLIIELWNFVKKCVGYITLKKSYIFYFICILVLHLQQRLAGGTNSLIATNEYCYFLWIKLLFGDHRDVVYKLRSIVVPLQIKYTEHIIILNVCYLWIFTTRQCVKMIDPYAK